MGPPPSNRAAETPSIPADGTISLLSLLTAAVQIQRSKPDNAVRTPAELEPEDNLSLNTQLETSPCPRGLNSEQSPPSLSRDSPSSLWLAEWYQRRFLSTQPRNASCRALAPQLRAFALKTRDRQLASARVQHSQHQEQACRTGQAGICAPSAVVKVASRQAVGCRGVFLQSLISHLPNLIS